jgi:hypothetical protein
MIFFGIWSRLIVYLQDRTMLVTVRFQEEESLKKVLKHIEFV